MSAPPPPPKEETEDEDWLVTYSDAITLLLAFFVMLVTFSKFDLPTMEEVSKGIREEIGHRKGKEGQTPTEALKSGMTDIVATLQANEVVGLGVDDKGLVIELANNAFFKPGTATLREESYPLLESMGELLAAPTYGYYIVDVQGHTDDDPIHTVQFPSNWELSTGRASAVVRFLVDQKVNPKRFKASGFADVRPKVPNRGSDGNPLKENQKKNRRVDIRVYPMSPEERALLLVKQVTIETLDEEPKDKQEEAPAKPEEAPADSFSNDNAPPTEETTAPALDENAAPPVSDSESGSFTGQ